MGTPGQRTSQREYAIQLAHSSFEWYQARAIRSRRVHKVVEVAVLATSVSIPAAAVVWPNEAVAPALLGALVALLAGLRTIFHWHDNYVRYSEAREAVNREIRLYEIGAAPYDDEHIADQRLVRAVSAIEQSEMSGWRQIAAAPAPEQEPSTTPDATTSPPASDL